MLTYADSGEMMKFFVSLKNEMCCDDYNPVEVWKIGWSVQNSHLIRAGSGNPGKSDRELDTSLP